jgi:hypothetical protein
MRLIFTVLGLPSLNQFDAAASLPLDMFGASLDLEPYTPLLPDRALFDPATAPKPSDPGFDWHALTESPVMDDPDDMRRGYRSPATADERNHRRSGDQERRR